MKSRTKVLLLFVLAVVLPLCVALAAVPPDVPIPPGDGGGSGSGCVTSCANYCQASGYWSSIGCLSNECAHCPCTGNPPLPYCTRR